MAAVLFGLAWQTGLAGAGQMREGNANFLIENWLEGDGLPESSAYALAQTPDGYLWVGTAEGVCRYNGNDFSESGRGLAHPVLDRNITYLFADRAGRLWASTDQGLGIRENKTWRTILATNLAARSMCEDATGQVWLGTFDGRLFTIQQDKMVAVPLPAGITPSGMFCAADRLDGGIWLANRGFVGRWTPAGWQRLGPPATLRNALLATPARQGGLWTYTPGHVTRYWADGRQQEFPAPNIEQPRVLMEDQSGALWLGSTSRGYLRFQPNGPVLATVTETNGLIHNTAWSILQDVEGNFWLGGSCNGLSRLRPRIFQTIGVENGLPCQIVSTVAEAAPDHLIVGTHGHGIARWQDGRMVAVTTNAVERGLDYVCSIVHDSRGRTWTGTYLGGLWLEENGRPHPFPLPASLGKTVNCLLEDSHQRLWLGTGSGLGYVDGDSVVDWGIKCGLAGTSVTCLAEDTNAGVLWLGTYDQGLGRLEGQQLIHYGSGKGLPGNRISALWVDPAGWLWFGMAGKGLGCFHENKFSFLGVNQGFPAATAGSLLDDGRGWLWICSDKGLLRTPLAGLQGALQGGLPPPEWDVFDASDGLYSAGCFEGMQPASLRTGTGRLWFATMGGLVGVNPDQIQLNTNVPPVVIERVEFNDDQGRSHDLFGPLPNLVRLHPGSSDLTVNFAALSFSAPAKNRYSYQLKGFDEHWVRLANRHNLYWHTLPPGAYELRIIASNNDHAWNTNGVVFAFVMAPFFWQTAWFPLLALVTVGVGGGLAAWRITHARLKRRIASLEQQRALERERARLAMVMEATNDLVAFADHHGRLLHLNPAGRKLLGLTENQDVSDLTLAGLLPARAATRFVDVALPAARLQGVWEGETTLLHRDGHEIPVTQTIMVHQGLHNGDRFLSTIARDLTERKRAEQASERLQAQLLQSQKMESVGRLAGGIAHDFNNMLQVILGNANLALEKAAPGSGLHDELLEIQQSASRSAELTGQLLTFARKQVFRARELDLNAALAGITKMLQRVIGENIQLVWQPGADLWPVSLDPSQVTQILTNLAINARDAITGQGRLNIELVNIVIAPLDARADPELVPGEYIRLSVQDNGHGMTREVMDHLFEPFFTTKDVGKGTGLGLATVFGIVKQNGGLIQVQSTPGQGTTFRLYFPRANHSPMNPDTPAPSQPLLQGTETILVVEDEQNILNLVVLTLKKRGYQVLAATVPESALELAAEHPGKIDLLITDIVMPGMNGKDLADQLVARQPGMKALFISGYTAEIIAQHGALEPGLHFLQKPFTIQSFLEKVRKTLDKP
jgi:PAS domain S-box-containing protein